MAAPIPIQPLTAAELRVLAALATGRTRPATAVALGVSYSSIHHHSRAIRAKLQAHTTAQAVAVAFHTGMLLARPGDYRLLAPRRAPL